MEAIKKLLKEEREQQDKKLDSVFKQYGSTFEGTGPQEYDPTTGGTTARVEEADDDYDPYNMLGYGFQAYFKSLTLFSCVFILLTIIMLPAFYWYAQAGGLKLVTHGYYNSVFMLGNLGFNKAVCLSSYVQLDADPTTLTCEVG